MDRHNLYKWVSSRSAPTRALLFLDAPDHPRIRKVLNAGFRPDILQGLAPHIEQVVTELLDRVAHLATFDFIEAVARPLPVRVIMLLLGIERPQEDFMDWSGNLATFIGEPRPSREQAKRAQTSLVAMSRYFESLLALRRKRGLGSNGTGQSVKRQSVTISASLAHRSRSSA